MNPYELLKPAAATVARKAKRMYAGAEMGRLTADWAPTSSSADAEIVTSLRILRNRSRQLVRDNEYASNAVRQVQQNVIGTGIGLQPLIKNARGGLIQALNDDVHEVFHDWWKESSSVHTAGILSGPDIERFLIGNIVESGEAFIRIVRQPFGDSEIPLAFELIESDRVMDQWTQQTAPSGNVIRMGVEMDNWHRPLAYWCWPTHPGDYQFASFQPSRFIRIPAEDMIHIYLVDRWPQSRGVPWFHAAMKRLNNMAGYEESEIIAARGSAAIMGFVTAPEMPAADDVDPDGKHVDDMEPGQIRHLSPGETFVGWNPSRPNAAMEPFLRLMLRGVASAIGMSYESLARDYSNTNYSSARAAQMEDRDLWKVIQAWFAGNFRKRLHREFMQAAVLANQISIPDFFTNEKKYVRAHFKPRGWSWIDPTKEVNAFQAAVRSGFMTVGDVISQTNNGRDAEDIFRARRQEIDMLAELDLVLDTDPAQVNKTGIAQPNTAPEEQVDEPAEPGEEAGQGDAPDEPAQPAAAPAAKPKPKKA